MQTTISEETAERLGGRYDMILCAANRARELKAGGKRILEDTKAVTEAVQAIMEIEEGVVGKEYLHGIPEDNLLADLD